MCSLRSRFSNVTSAQHDEQMMVLGQRPCNNLNSKIKGETASLYEWRELLQC